MSTTRRDFLTHSSLGLLAAAAAATALPADEQQPTAQLPAGAPPAFGTAPAVGPQVSVETFREAEKLVQVEFTEQDLAQAAGSWRNNLAGLYERRTGPRKLALEESLAPATQWNPALPGAAAIVKTGGGFTRSADPGLPLPSSDDAIAFAPIWQLSRTLAGFQVAGNFTSAPLFSENILLLEIPAGKRDVHGEAPEAPAAPGRGPGIHGVLPLRVAPRAWRAKAWGLP